MNRNNSIWLKQLAAALLLGAFALLHAVKILHHHHSAEPVSVNKFTAAVNLLKATVVDQSTGKLSSECSICDFHLAKNAEPPVTEFSTVAFIPHKPVYTAYISASLASYTALIAGRGPPAVA